MVVFWPKAQHFTFHKTFMGILQTDSFFSTVLDIWFDNMDYITQPERRKLSALALASLLAVNSRYSHFELNGYIETRIIKKVGRRLFWIVCHWLFYLSIFNFSLWRDLFGKLKGQRFISMRSRSFILIGKIVNLCKIFTWNPHTLKKNKV